ncbi:MAG: arylamine N-acetyltransferase [Simkania sp.]|nr:arylamine N-acetyltransferase [Simkania sp.]MCB1074097.1 arylamine N-acetyltransferase [Simkania sp.]
MQIEEYLKRIGYEGTLDQSLETLQKLQRLHLQHIPFENLDIHLGREISLELPDVFEKLVRKKRGGYCYEMNGLLAWALDVLGFQVTLHDAKLYANDGTLLPTSQHLVLLVYLQETWIVDVGWGKGFTEPLLTETSFQKDQMAQIYCSSSVSTGYQVKKLSKDGKWKPLYELLLASSTLEDFKERNRYHQTSPDSLFRKYPICILLKPEGYFELRNKQFTMDVNGEKKLESINESQMMNCLSEKFGICLTN